MHSNWWLTTLTFIEMATLSSVLFLMVKKRRVGKWPCLFVCLAMELATNVFLMAILGWAPYKLYFYVYWGSLGLRALLRLGVIADIMRTFKGIDFLPYQIYIYVGIAGLAMAAGAGTYCFHQSATPGARTIGMAFLLNRCVAIAWGTFSVAFLAPIKMLNLGWEKPAARIANGIFFRICAEVLTSGMFIMGPRSIRLLANGLDSLCTIIVFSYWTYLLLYVPPSPLPATEVENPPTNHHRLEMLAMSSSRES